MVSDKISDNFLKKHEQLWFLIKFRIISYKNIMDSYRFLIKFVCGVLTLMRERKED